MTAELQHKVAAALKAYQDRETTRKARQACEDLRAVLELPAGRRFLARLSHETCAGEDAVKADLPTETLQAIEARRAVGVDLLEEARQLHPDLWFLMEQERITDRARDATNLRAITRNEDPDDG